MERFNCVLLVDDDKINNCLNERLFKILGIARNVQVVSNGEQALLYITKHGSPYDPFYPDLILLDYTMPQMSGKEFITLFNKINSSHRHKSRIVVLSSSTDPEVRKKMLKLGVDDFMEKPLNEEKINQLIIKEQEKPVP